MQPVIHLNIKDRGKVFFDGEVNAVSSYNEIGLFDVLPLHENFVSLIKDKIILHNPEGIKEMKIETGLLKVRGDKVNIYLGV
jgi:F0F1-type ATP synthase epsilon subunit